MDYNQINVENLLRSLASSGNMIGDDGNTLLRMALDMLDCITQKGDEKALGSLIGFIENYIEKAGIILNCAELSEYIDILHKRVVSFNQYINTVRNREYHSRHGIKDESSRFKGKGVVYSVVVGGYDDIRDPLIVDDDLDYIMFTDNKEIRSDIWDMRLVDNPTGMDAFRLSRYYKVMSHEALKDYDYSIYIDGKIQIKGDIGEYISKYSTGEAMICLNHYLNTDIYEEAEHCKRLGKGNAEDIDRQMEDYKKAGFPHMYGMTDCCFMIRDHHDEGLRRMMEMWWQEIQKYSTRDQLSFSFCCRETGLYYDSAPIYINDNPYIKQFDHFV